MNKVYSRINWQNYPSEGTPLNETNLNKIDLGVDTLDDRIITLDTEKVSHTNISNNIKDWNMDTSTGVITLTKYDGSQVLFDLNIEKIPVNFELSSDGVLTMETSDGTKFTANIGDMIPVLTFEDSDTIAVTVSGSGINKTYSFSVKNGSITEEKLQPNYLADIKIEVGKAQQAEQNAETHENNAKTHADNAENYKNDTLGYMNSAKISMDNAKASEDNARQSELNASNSAVEAQGYRDTTLQYKTDTEGYKNAAQGYMDATEGYKNSASASATSAKQSEDNAKVSEDNASTSELNAKSYETLARSYKNESNSILLENKETLAEIKKVTKNVSFSVDFETGNLIQDDDSSYKFHINNETGNLEWEVNE